MWARRVGRGVEAVALGLLLCVAFVLGTGLGHLIGLGVIAALGFLPLPLHVFVETLLVLLPFILLARYLLHE